MYFKFIYSIFIYLVFSFTELAHTIAIESRQFEDQRHSLTRQLQDAKDELKEIRQSRQTHDQRTHELDELTRQLLHLNDALVAKLSHSSQANTSLRKMLGVTKKVHIPAPTESVKARRRSPIRTQEEISAKEKDLFGDEEIEHLQALHDMYKGLAKSLEDSRPPNNAFENTSKNPVKIIRRVKSSPDRSPSKPVLFHRTYQSNDSFQSRPEYDTDGDDSALAIAEDLRAATLDRSHREFLDLSLNRTPFLERHHTSSNQAFESATKTSSSSNGDGPTYHSPSTQNLEKVIKSLEDEFESLTAQYKQILAAMQTDPDVSRPGLPESSLRNSEQLIAVIQQLQRKGEQLRALKA